MPWQHSTTKYDNAIATKKHNNAMARNKINVQKICAAKQLRAAECFFWRFAIQPHMLCGILFLIMCSAIQPQTFFVVGFCFVDPRVL